MPRHGDRLELNAMVAGIGLTVVVLVPADLGRNLLWESKTSHELSRFGRKEVSAIDALRYHVHSYGPFSALYNDLTSAG